MLLIANRNITPKISGVEMIYTQLSLLDMGAIKYGDRFLSSSHTAKHAVGIFAKAISRRGNFLQPSLHRVKHVAGILQYTNLFDQ